MHTRNLIVVLANDILYNIGTWTEVRPLLAIRSDIICTLDKKSNVMFRLPITLFASYWNKIYATPHEISKPCVCTMLKYVTVSFRSMKAIRMYLLWMQFLQTFYVCVFMWKKIIFSPEIFVKHKCLVFLCVCTCTNLLMLNTEVKNLVYPNSVAMGQINQCWFQSYVVLINNVYLWK